MAERLETVPVPTELDLWVIPSLNPDGVAAHSRTNAHGVDLNRNFPWRWQPLRARGDLEYSGPRAASEPETQLAIRTIEQLRPDITIWFHQPLDVVDESGGKLAIERRYAQLTGMALRRLPRYRGGVTNWQNANFPGTTAFVVENPAGPLSPKRVDVLARAVVVLSSRGA